MQTQNQEQPIQRNDQFVGVDAAPAVKKEISKKKRLTLNITLTSILSALGAVLMIFPKFPILPAFPWLDLDISDTTVLLATFVINPVYGVIVAVVKNLVHLPFTSTGYVGELSNALCSSTFALSAGLVYHRKKSFKTAVISLCVAVISVVVVACFTNWYIMIIVYFDKAWRAANGMEYIFAGVIPFNFIKFTFQSLIILLIYKPISKALKNRYYKI